MARAEELTGRPRRGPGRPALLTRERIGRAAFDLVDQHGPGALTVNRLAEELGVGTMTLYGYVDSKDAIVAMLPDLLLADLPEVDPEEPWRAYLERVYLSIYRRFTEHHRVLQVIASSSVFGRAQAQVVEGVLDRLARAGLSREDAFAIQRTLATYTVGFALFAVAERAAGSPRPRTSWRDELDPAEFPRIAEFSDLLGEEVDEAAYLRGARGILGGAGDQSPS